VFEKCLDVEVSENLDQRRYHPGPTGLMTGADTGAVVAVKILVEQQIIPPMGIVRALANQL
jgi:hypothetical protein